MTLESILKSGVSAISNPELRRQDKYTAFGWYWEPTERVTHLIDGLVRRRDVGDVWRTPQIDAVCWLLGLDRFPLPARFVPEVHELFCTVAFLHRDFSAEVPKLSEVQDALADIQKLRRELKVALRKIRNANPQILAMALDWSDAHIKLAKAHHSVIQLDDFFSGVVEHPRMVTDRVQQKKTIREGRVHNWASEVVAMKCADIYRTAFGTPPRPRDGHPSFQTFLEKFSVGFPDAERADAKRLAQMIQRQGYDGEQMGLLGQVRDLP